MAMKKALGRGLDALISSPEEALSVEGTIRNIPLGDIIPNKSQPRSSFDQESIDELARSIRENGLIQPIVVRQSGSGYEIVVGERRFRAASVAGLEDIPAVVKDYSDDKLLELALIENVQREDLNPIEEARAYRMILERDRITQEALSGRIGKSRSYIANMVRLLDLPESVQDYVSRGTISVGQAKALASLKSETEQEELLGRIIEENLNVREVERIARTRAVPRGTEEPTAPAGRSEVRKKSRAPFVDEVEDRLRTLLGTKVAVEYRKGRGSIRIEFYGDEDLGRILEILGG
jgi:ParB family chromosome partitioning protein